jgi:hypothetical protein
MYLADLFVLVVSDVECPIAVLFGFLHPKYLIRINKLFWAFTEAETSPAPQYGNYFELNLVSVHKYK